MKINTHTDQNTVDSLSKGELIFYCKENNLSGYKGLLKWELVSLVWAHVSKQVDKLKQEEADREEKEERLQAEAVAADLKNPISQAVLKGLLENLEKKISGSNATLESFTKRILSSGISDAFSWKGEEAIEAEAVKSYCLMMTNFLSDLKEHTVEQKIEIMGRQAENLIDECLRSYTFKHNSTSPYSNICKGSEAAAKQDWTKWMRAAHKTAVKALECDNAEDAYRLGCWIMVY